MKLKRDAEEHPVSFFSCLDLIHCLQYLCFLITSKVGNCKVSAMRTLFDENGIGKASISKAVE